MSFFDDGLAKHEMVKQMEAADWLNAPVGKDKISADVNELSKLGKIKQSGSTKKWRLVT